MTQDNRARTRSDSAVEAGRIDDDDDDDDDE